MKNRLIALSMASACTLAQAGPIIHTDFSDLSRWQLNGVTGILNPNAGNVLRLTDDLGQAGSAFLEKPISLHNHVSFSTAFDFQISDPQGISDMDGQGADGIVFVVQTRSNTAGSAGEGIGYQGLGNSVGIEFDTWYNGHLDQDGNHVGINLGGSSRSVVYRGVDERMNNGEIWNAWIDYDGSTDLLEVRLTSGGSRPQDPLLSLNVDLESILGRPDAYVGFTSGTGGAGGDHDILNMQFRDDFNPIRRGAASVPLPASVLFLASGLFGIVLRRTVRQRPNL